MQIKKILVFQDVMPLLKEVRAFLSQKPMSFIVTVNGKDTVSKTLSQSPVAIVISEKMQDLQVIDIINQLKDKTKAPFFILSKEDNKELHEQLTGFNAKVLNQNDFQIAVGEFLLPLMEADLAGFLKKLSGPKTSEASHVASNRFLTQGSIHFTSHGINHEGQVKNISQAGVLFVSDANVENGGVLTLNMQAPDDSRFMVQAQLVRSQDLAQGKKAFGLKFLDLSADTQEKIQKWIEVHKIFSGQNGNDSNTFGPGTVRENKRVKISQTIEFWFEQSNLQEREYFSGQLLNISLSGVLIATEQVVPDQTVLGLRIFNNEEPIELVFEVVRTQKLKQNIESYQFGTGGKFVGLSNAQKNEITLWIRKEPFLRKNTLNFVNLQMVEKIFHSPYDVLIKEFKTPGSQLGAFFFSETSEFEKKCLSQDDDHLKSVKLSSLLRLKFILFHKAIFDIKHLDESLIKKYFGLFEALLKESVSCEQMLDDSVKAAIGQSDDRLKLSLNESSNLLFEEKIHFAKELVAQLSFLDSFKSHGAYVSALALVEQSKIDDSTLGNQVKYNKKKKVEEAKAQVKEKHEKQKKPIGLFIAGGALFLMIVGGYLYSYMSSFVSTKDLNLAVDVSSIRADEEGLLVSIHSTHWDRLTLDLKTAEIEKIQEYLIKKKLRQVKITNEKNELLATSALIEKLQGQKPRYALRIRK